MSEVYIAATARTPFGRYHGALADYSAIQLGELALRAVIRKAGVKSDQVEAVFAGNVLSEGLGQNPARQIALGAGLTQATRAVTINDVCGSSLKAIRMAEGQIRMGDFDLVAVGGTESMSNTPKEFMLKDGLLDAFSKKHMGLTAEKVADQKHISRHEQDAFAYQSHTKAYSAWKNGWFKDEVVPVPELAYDENIRPDTSPEALAALKPVFKQNGSVTAGNASPLSDGACMLLLASEKAVMDYNLHPIARMGAYAEVGIDPSVMGLAPHKAIPKLLAKTGRPLSDYDAIEINEAFAATTVAVGKALGIPEYKLNPAGGALAIGHPLGASGARIVGALANDLVQFDGVRGIASLCIGGGQGIALEIKRVR